VPEVCGWNGAHPGLQERNLLNHTRIENAVIVRKKTFVFCYVAVKYKTTTGGKEQIRASLSHILIPAEMPINDEARMCPGVYADSHIEAKVCGYINTHLGLPRQKNETGSW